MERPVRTTERSPPLSTSIDPYEPPKAALEAQPPAPAPGRRAGLLGLHPTARSALAVGIALGLAVVGLLLEDALHVRALVTTCFVAALLSTVYGAYSGLRGVVAFAKGTSSLKGLGVLGSLVAVAANGLLAFMTFLGTVMATTNFQRGRQIRRFGKALLPRVLPGRAWASLRFTGLPEAARVTAAQWRENGRTEHASVAAFAKLTGDLMALGAPPALLAAAQRDALDEIRHTELCFSLARALDGQDESPGPFPEARRPRPLPLGRTFALGALATDSLIDGALHEGLSARVLSKLARRCEVWPVSAMLKEIARDEGRHAAHAWDVTLWCVAEGGEPVLLALISALAAVPEEMASPLPVGARDGGWERFGIHGHALEQGEYRATLASIRARVAALGRREAVPLAS